MLSQTLESFPFYNSAAHITKHACPPVHKRNRHFCSVWRSCPKPLCLVVPRFEAPQHRLHLPGSVTTSQLLFMDLCTKRCRACRSHALSVRASLHVTLTRTLLRLHKQQPTDILIEAPGLCDSSACPGTSQHTFAAIVSECRC